MTVVQSLLQHKMSMNRALKMCGVTKKRWCYKPKQQELAINLHATNDTRNTGRDAVLRHAKGSSGDIQKAGQVVNHKTVRRIYRKMGWNRLKRAQSTKARWTPIKAERPNEVWETDITCA